ncbi:hypothetical protein GOBAR_AA35394 [Gossypium barbadense]|uniref:Uncharacterized protein n=1 Tax=Gossypium barbadense TaxID=3634 RepID=A0A2P5W2H9_GOSBA|nr:hypothetical protein GOBAR_AA35394 [Gossypium barbadense]
MDFERSHRAKTFFKTDPMSQEQQQPPPSPPFDPSRMIGIIKRKALIKELAAVYHAECLAKCQELLELQKKWDEGYMDSPIPTLSIQGLSWLYVYGNSSIPL